MHCWKLNHTGMMREAAQCLERTLRAPIAPRRTNDMDALFSHDVRNIRIQWVLNETHDFSMSQGGGTHNMPPGWGGTHASWLYVQLQACWMSCSTITFRQATHISFVQTAWGLSPHLHARCLECNSWCLHMHACRREEALGASILWLLVVCRKNDYVHRLREDDVLRMKEWSDPHAIPMSYGSRTHHGCGHVIFCHGGDMCHVPPGIARLCILPC